MEIDKEIENILNQIYHNNNYTKKYEDDFYDDNIDDEIAYKNFQNYKLIIDTIINKEELVIERKADRKFILTTKGNKIVKEGGWLKHLISIEESKKNEFEKNNYDFLSKKWLYKTRFLPFILSFIAIIVSIYVAFFKANKENFDNKSILEQFENSKNQNKILEKKIEILENKINTLEQKNKTN